jgi:phosphoribosyl 1,2-cyclic phosphodiesterase
MQAGVTVSFYGVRGSTPCACTSMARIGGNTSCVVIEREGEDPIVCDSGTGLRFYGLGLGTDHFDGTVLISHLHWDHVQGLPFFPQILNDKSTVEIVGPSERDMSFREALFGFVRPPYFPVNLDALASRLSFNDLWNESFTVGSATVTARSVPHNGRTNGYRIEWDDLSIAYIPDHQEPENGTDIAPGVLELVDGVDLLIHDSQFTPELLAARGNWGHCTPRYAAHVADTGGAKALAMFHHDPLHDDDDVDALLAEAQTWDTSCEIVAAAEGMKISL